MFTKCYMVNYAFILENFLLIFCHLATKRKGAVNHTKDSFGNDDPKSLCFQNKNSNHQI